MHDAMKFALVHGAHWHHQSAIAQGRLHIGLKDAVLFTLGNNAAQGAVDAAGHMGNRRTQVTQLGRSGILDVSRFIQDMPNGNTQLWEGLKATGKFAQARIRVARFSIL